MTDSSGWPDPQRPGLPLNHERDGWHWVAFADGTQKPFQYKAPGVDEDGAYSAWWYPEGLDRPYAQWPSEPFYRGPCPTPAEVAALTAENAKMRETLSRIERADFNCTTAQWASAMRAAAHDCLHPETAT